MSNVQRVMKLPTVEQAEQLLDKYSVPQNIREHCRAVSALATSIAEKLSGKGIHIDVELVHIGSLLHDMMKAATFERLTKTKKFNYTPTEKETAVWNEFHKRFKGMHESEIAYELLKDDYPELAQFILKEGALSKNPFKHRDWEEKVVHYADWRTLGTEIVPLDTRLDDFFVRYKKLIKTSGADRWEKVREAEHKAEREICNALGETPEMLVKSL